MKKILILGFLLSLIVETHLGARASETPKKIYIPVISKSVDAPFFQQIKLGTEQAAKDFGIETTYEGPTRGGPAEVQLDMFKAALSKNPQAMVLIALDSTAITPYLEEAAAAGIPVIGMDSGVDSPIVKTTITTDNYGAGALAAEKMGELLEGQGKVGVIALDPTSKVAIDRTDGFIDTLSQNYPNIQVLPVQYGSGSRMEAIEATKAFLADHPDLAGLYGQNASISDGIVEAIKELDKVGEVTIIGFDSSQVLTDAIREGVAAGAITQNPIGMGYLGIQAALQAYRGEELPAFINPGFFWYDKSNIDSPEIKQYLFE